MDKPFFPPDQIVPETLSGEDFILVPLTADLVEIDYEAVMSSREMLLVWAGGTWPREGFTIEENLQDLQWHEQEHSDRVAFTYSVLDPAQEMCLGCLYIRPINDLIEKNPTIVERSGRDEAIARFWVRTSLLDSDFDLHLLLELWRWFENDWPFARLYFHTRSVNKQQASLFSRAKLEKEMTLHYASRGGNHDFYRVVPAP